MELFAQVVNGLKSLTIFARSTILDGWQGSEYTQVKYRRNIGITIGDIGGNACRTRGVIPRKKYFILNLMNHEINNVG